MGLKKWMMSFMLVLLLCSWPTNGLLFSDKSTVYASEDVWLDDVSVTVPQQEPLWEAEIGKFERAFDLWTLAVETGAKGDYVRDTSEHKSGAYSGKLIADFSGGGTNVSLGRNFSPMDMKKLEFWVKTADASAILLLVKDSTGQVHQQKFFLAQTNDWQKIEVFQFNAGTSYVHYNGANDGVWHGPAQELGIMVEKSGLVGGKTSGVIYLDDVIATSALPELVVQQSQMGNVFLANENVSFPLVTKGDAVRWSVFDHLDHKVMEGRETVQKGQLDLTIPLQKLGYFKLNLAAEKDGRSMATAEVSFARLSEQDPTLADNSPFGVSTHLSRTNLGWSPELSTLLRRAGAKNFRDEITWVDVEFEKGKYRKPANRDAFMRSTKQEGLKPFITLDFTNPFYDEDSTPYSDEGREGFANYGKALLDLYGNQMEWVEVYNEFNGGFGDRGNGPADSRPDYYFKLLKKTYETVKAARPDVTVVGMVTDAAALSWMEEVMKLGGLQYMDAVSVHPYNRTPDGMIKAISDTQSLIRKYNHGQDKPLWSTEIGWPTHTGNTGVDEKTQADYLVRAHVQSLGAGIEKIFWYDLMNDGLKADYGEDNFGLIRHQKDPNGQHTPKSAFAAYAAMTRELTGAHFVEQDSYGEGISSYRFEKDGQNLRVVWANSPVQAAIQTDHPIRMTDMMGNTETFTPLNGKIYLTLTGEPFYVESDMDGIAVDTTFTLAAEEAVAGEPLRLTVETNNTTSAPIDVSLSMEGSQYPLYAASGQKTALSVSLPGLSQEGARYITGYLIVNGQIVGRLEQTVRTSSAYEAKVLPVILDTNKKSEALRVQIRNQSKVEGLTIKKADWIFGSQTGSQEGNVVIPPSTMESINIPLNGFDFGVSYPVQVTVYFDGKEPFVYEGKFDFNPIIRGTVQVDGTVDPGVVAQPPLVELSKGTVKMQNYTGPADLDGSIWANWDQDYFYLTAKIKDDVHSAPASGEEIWKNDSIQFAMMAGMPGENMGYYELGISDTPQGPQIYRWLSPDSGPKGLVANGSLQVKRDETQKLTVYEMALPWSELAQVKPSANEALSISFLVNDNDGAGRKGYIEWGSGIGEVKDSKKFRTAQWINNPTSPIITIQGVKEGESYTDQVIPVVKAETEDGQVLDPRIQLDGEPWTAGTPITAIGEHTLVVQAGDPAGMMTEQKLTFKLYHSTVLEMSNVEGQENDTVLLRAALHDKNGQAISGENVTFSVNDGEPIGSAVTDADGVAALSYKIPTQADPNQENIYPLTASYIQNDVSYLLGSEGTGQLKVNSSPKPDPQGVPGKPVLSDNQGNITGIKDGRFTITMNMWWGNNGTTYKLYENDVLVDTQSLTDYSPNAQTAVTSALNRKNGTYRYFAELSNASGTTRSDVHTVTVTDASPAVPVLSHDNWDGDGNFKVSMNMWWGTNGATYRLYENDILIDTQVLKDQTPNAQSAITDFHDKPIGTYEYRCELLNDAGVTSSENMIVKVTK